MKTRQFLSLKKFKNVVQKFGGKEKMSTFALPLKNGWLIRLKVLRKTGAGIKNRKFLQKDLEIKK